MLSKQGSTVLTILVICATWIYPIWPYEQALHNSLTLVGAIYLWWYLQKNTLSNNNFLLICLFFIVHSIAARWLYSNLPYDIWAKQIFGSSLSELFGWRRNHADRAIHFLYGVCFTPAITQHFSQRYHLARHTALKLAVGIIMVSSLCYEWFEWLVAVTLSPEDAEAYNGQQGDMWDAHKDMLCATIGSLLWWFYYRNDNKKAV